MDRPFHYRAPGQDVETVALSLRFTIWIVWDRTVFAQVTSRPA
ncbi:hypothetical protein [Nocardia africana]|uniref:Uncharacterized protein n=1 Tax=Nocardia africana TaxID=134964 RepID=A0ABW6NH81_9NOCA